MILTDEEIHQLDFDLCHSLRLKENQLAFARAIEREVLRKLRDQKHAASISGQWRLTDSGSLQRVSGDGLTPLHIIPEVNE